MYILDRHSLQTFNFVLILNPFFYQFSKKHGDGIDRKYDFIVKWNKHYGVFTEDPKAGNSMCYPPRE